MTKMLNMDEIQSEAKKVLKLNGNEHQLKEMSVSEFIKLTLEAEKDDGKEMLLSAQVKKLVELAGNAFPTIPVAELKALSLDQLNTIISFARGGLEDEEEKEKK